MPSRAFIVVGVVREAGTVSCSPPTCSPSYAVYLPTGWSRDAGTSLMLRVRGEPRTDAPGAGRTSHERGSRARPDQHHADDGRDADVHSAFRLPGDRRPWRAGARVDGVGPVQRPVVRRRAAGEGYRRAHGARRDHPQRGAAWCCRNRSARSVSVSSAGGGLAAAAAIVLMATPAASAIGDIVHVFDPVAYALRACWLFVTCVRARRVGSRPARAPASIRSRRSVRTESPRNAS